MKAKVTLCYLYKVDYNQKIFYKIEKGGVLNEIYIPSWVRANVARLETNKRILDD